MAPLPAARRDRRRARPASPGARRRGASVARALRAAGAALLALPALLLAGALGALVALALTGPARAAAGEAALCMAAAERAARAHGVPAPVLRALTLTETGRRRDGRFEPWPWTVNMEGEGRWFDDPAEALDYVARERARGARSFDVGCFQVNHLWHGDAFPSVAAMFDPDANADYAARFLKGLHVETGDWTAAAGLYHSRTPKFRDRYAARFAEILARAPEPLPQEAAPGPTLWRAAALPRTAGATGMGLLTAAAGPLAAPARGPLISGGARPLID